MRSLTAHLRDDDAHDRLPFHPSCPICRQTRLTGALAAGGLVSLRTQALLAAGVLAVSATAPVTVAFAAEPDQQQDGAAPVAQSGAPDPPTSPDFDPGGEATDLPQPRRRCRRHRRPATRATTTPRRSSSRRRPTPTIRSSTPATARTRRPRQQPAVARPTAPRRRLRHDPRRLTGGADDASARRRRSLPRRRQHATPRRGRRVAASPRDASSAAAKPAAPAEARREHRARSHAVPRVPARAGPSAPAPRRGMPASPASAAVARGRAIERTRCSRASRSGRSPPTCSAATRAPPQVAREVHRLWQLNRDRIGTGDPDLLMVGTRLVLR